MAKLLSLLLLLLLCSACSGPDPQDMGLNIDFACDADRAATESIVLRVLRGGCDGEDVVYEAVLARGQAAEERVLSPGRYGIEVSARGDAGAFASVCVEERLPSDALKVVLPSSRCGDSDGGARESAVPGCVGDHCPVCALGEPSDCTCWEETYEGRSYWFCDSPLQWAAARDLCRMHQRDLVIVDSAEENAFLTAHAKGASHWIGASDRGDDGIPPIGVNCRELCAKNGDEGTWQWVDPINNKADGVTFCEAENGSSQCAAVDGRYMNWEAGEPSNGGNACAPYVRCDEGEDCAVLTGTSGSWQDASCGSKLRFICETY